MRTDRLRLLDATEQIEMISKFSEHGREAFFSDVLVQSAILHRLALLGEACRGVSHELREAHGEFPVRRSSHSATLKSGVWGSASRCGGVSRRLPGGGPRVRRSAWRCPTSPEYVSELLNRSTKQHLFIRSVRHRAAQSASRARLARARPPVRQSQSGGLLQPAPNDRALGRRIIAIPRTAPAGSWQAPPRLRLWRRASPLPASQTAAGFPEPPQGPSECQTRACAAPPNTKWFHTARPPPGSPPTRRMRWPESPSTGPCKWNRRSSVSSKSGARSEDCDPTASRLRVSRS